jgi:hypothetical protein
VTRGKSPRARVTIVCNRVTPWPCWRCVSRCRPLHCAARIT